MPLLSIDKLTERQVEAWQYKCNGLTTAMIARRMGISRQRVHQLIGEIDRAIQIEAVKRLKVLTAADVCGILRCSREMVRRLIRIGELQAFKLMDEHNSAVRISQDSLRRYIERREAMGAGEEAREDMFTVRQVSEILKISMASVYHLIQEGKLSSINVGTKKCMRVTSGALNDWISKKSMVNDG